MSPLPITISPEAEADLSAACDWYEKRRSGLGETLRFEFRDALKAIQKSPLLRPVIYSNARRFFMKRFRYHVYYSVYPDAINILAVVHVHRHPRVWKKQLRERS